MLACFMHFLIKVDLHSVAEDLDVASEQWTAEREAWNEETQTVQAALHSPQQQTGNTEQVKAQLAALALQLATSHSEVLSAQVNPSHPSSHCLVPRAFAVLGSCAGVILCL